MVLKPPFRTKGVDARTSGLIPAPRCRSALALAFLFCLGGFSAAFYADPPHAEVARHNDQLGPLLQGIRVPIGGTRPPSHPLRFFSIDVHAVYPSVDGMVSSNHPPRVLWGWSYDAQTDFDWDGSLSGCGSNRSRMRLDGVSGQFRLHSQLPGVLRVHENPSSPAFSGFDSAELSSSRGPLSVTLDGRIFLQYDREVHTVQCRSFCYWNGCSVQSWVDISHDSPVYDYSASSPSVSLPLVHPANQTVSFTPWIRNFSLFLPSMQAYFYSNTSLYWLESLWDGMRTGYQRFQSFDARPDARGALSVVSVPNRSAGSHDVSPARFQSFASTSYRYAYRVDQALDSRIGPGVHTWAVSARDFFNDAVQLQEDFLGHDSARLSVELSPASIPVGQPVGVSVRLSDRAARPLSGLPFVLETSEVLQNLTSDARGLARAQITFRQPGAHRIVARFLGSAGLAPTFADAVVYVHSEPISSEGVLRRYDGLLLGVIVVLALCAVRFR